MTHLKIAGTVPFAAAFCLLAAASTGRAALLLNEPFTYPNGRLDIASGEAWTYIGGSGNGIVVTDNSVRIDDNGGTDKHSRPLGSVVSTGKVFASFTLNVSAADLPSSTSGQYFAHFADETLSGANTKFISRVFLASSTTAGLYRIGISGSSDTATFYPTALTPGTTYTIVQAYDLDADIATLYVNPSAVTSTNVTSNSAITTSTISRFALRIAGVTDGDKTIDDLRVGTAFADVVPEPTALIALAGAAVTALRRRRR